MRRSRGSRKRGSRKRKKSVKNEKLLLSEQKDGRRKKIRSHQKKKKFRNDYEGYEIETTTIPILNEPIDPERFFKEFVAKRRYVAQSIQHLFSHQCYQHNNQTLCDSTCPEIARGRSREMDEFNVFKGKRGRCECKSGETIVYK